MIFFRRQRKVSYVEIVTVNDDGRADQGNIIFKRFGWRSMAIKLHKNVFSRVRLGGVVMGGCMTNTSDQLSKNTFLHFFYILTQTFLIYIFRGCAANFKVSVACTWSQKATESSPTSSTPIRTVATLKSFHHLPRRRRTRMDVKPAEESLPASHHATVRQSLSNPNTRCSCRTMAPPDCHGSNAGCGMEKRYAWVSKTLESR